MKKFLVVVICLLTILSLSACNKDDEVISTESPNYAINETRDPIEEDLDNIENISDDSIVSTEPVIEEPTIDEPEITIKDASDQIYNVEFDEYASDIYDMSTISIDGKLIGFPCTYQYVTEIFGQLHTIEYNSRVGDTLKPIDETITAQYFDVYAIPTTGEGTIRFTFRSTSDNPSTITEMTCYEVMIRGGNTTGDKVMTFALPEFITFGSTLQDLLNVYGVENATHYESSNNAADYRVRFIFKDINQCYDFTGYDNGLYIAKINYNYSE